MTPSSDPTPTASTPPAPTTEAQVVDSANGKKVLVKTGHEDGSSVPVWAVAGLGACVTLLGGVLGWLLWWKPRRDAAEEE